MMTMKSKGRGAGGEEDNPSPYLPVSLSIFEGGQPWIYLSLLSCSLSWH
jgi:hypothetical protein